MNLDIMKELLAIAGSLDDKGFVKEADIIDRIVKSAATGDGSTARRYDRLMEMQERTGPGEIDDGSGYTYDYLENEDAFIVRTTPPENWYATGYKMPRGHAGYDNLQEQGFGPKKEEGVQVVFDDSNTVHPRPDLEAKVLSQIQLLYPENDFRGNENFKHYREGFVNLPQYSTLTPEAMNQLLSDAFENVRVALTTLMNRDGLPFEESKLRETLKSTVPAQDLGWVELIVYRLKRVNAVKSAAEAQSSARVNTPTQEVPMAGQSIPTKPQQTPPQAIVLHFK